MIKDQVITLINGDVDNFKPEPWKVYAGLPNEKYHAQKEYESSTSAKKLLVSVKHWLDQEFKETDAMALGTQFHDALECLQKGKDLSDMITVIDRYSRTKESIGQFIIEYRDQVDMDYPLSLEEMTSTKVKRDELIEVAIEIEKRLSDGKKIVDQDTFDTSNSMVNAIKDHPEAGKLLKLGGLSELSFFAEKPVMVDGEEVIIKVRVRPDLLIELEDQIWIIDWKSIGKEATDHNITRACWNYRYDFSGAMYVDVISEFTDNPVYFNLVFAETNKPCKEKVRLVCLPDHDLEAAYNDYIDALMKKAKFIKNKLEWIGFPLPDSGIDFIHMRRSF